jgi:chemotaxis protein methyltransferase CheR
MHAALRDWDISIQATDINPHSLRKAIAGVYTHWSFRNTPAGFKENYFTETAAGCFELLPSIKEMVTFSSFNLAEDCYPSPNSIDVIFCRNVLMYFAPQLIRKVVAHYRHCLRDDGWLLVSSCETSNPIFSGFEPMNFPDAILYKKVNCREVSKPKSTMLIPSIPIRSQPPAPAPPPHPVQAATAPFSLLHQSSHVEISDYQKALTHYEHGAYSEASKMIALLLALDENDTEALTLQCRIYANEGRLEEALKTSEQALTADKLSSGLHYLRAVILQEQGMNNEAIDSLKKALYLDQDLVMAHFTLANLEQRKGKVKESRRHFSAALSLLGRYSPEDVIPDSEGMVAWRLTEIIRYSTDVGDCS